MCACVCEWFQEGVKGAVMRFMHTHVCGTFWRHVAQKELRMDAFLDMPQAGEDG